MTDAVIVSAVRTPVGKAPNGTLRGTRPDELAATVIAEALRRAPGLDAGEIDDVILGCAMPEGEQGLNVARIASLRAGVPVSASAVTINRFCSSGLQAIAFAAERIMCGFASAIVAGGTESMSLVPMGGNKLSPNPALVDSYPDVYLTTGLVAENHARESRRPAPADRSVDGHCRRCDHWLRRSSRRVPIETRSDLRACRRNQRDRKALRVCRLCRIVRYWPHSYRPDR
jgi:acetyl-CoA acyltransferase